MWLSYTFQQALSRQLSDLRIIYLPTWLLLCHKSVCFLLEALGDPRLSISEGDRDQVRVRDKSALAKLAVYQNSGSRMSAQNWDMWWKLHWSSARWKKQPWAFSIGHMLFWFCHSWIFFYVNCLSFIKLHKIWWVYVSIHMSFNVSKIKVIETEVSPI